MDALEFIPKDKCDTSGIENLKELTSEEISSISFQLLEWIQDINWPVAQSLLDVLPIFHRELLSDIRYILRDEVKDTIWKFVILSNLITQFPLSTIQLLQQELCQLSNSIAKDEDEQDVVDMANILLSKISTLGKI